MSSTRRDNREVADAVANYRRAIRAGDWDEVRSATDVDGGAQADLDHPLLRRTSGVHRGRFEALTTRVREDELRQQLPEMSAFWQRASAKVVAVRWIHDDEAEAYESVTVDGSERQTVVHLVHDDRWRVRSVDIAPDTHVRIVVPSRNEVVLEPGDFRERLVSRWDEGVRVSQGEERVEFEFAAGSVVGVSVGARDDLRQWPGLAPELATVLDDHVAAVELSARLGNDFNGRLDQLVNIALVAGTLAEKTDDAIVLVDSSKVVGRREFLKQVESALTSYMSIVKMWLNVVDGGDYLFTQGLGPFGLRELEMPARSDRAESARALRRLAEYFADAAPRWNPGDTISIGDDPAYRIEEGRRGPTPQTTYGRFGSLKLVPSGGER